MKRKQYVKTILHCNQDCGNFYHNYDDKENCWCSKLNKKVAPAGPADVMNDYTSRKIPKDCPLDDEGTDSKMQIKSQIEKRMWDVWEGIGNDMAPNVVQASRVSAVQELNWVLGDPIDPVKLDKLWHEMSGIMAKEI